jgi:hypothetical protein
MASTKHTTPEQTVEALDAARVQLLECGDPDISVGTVDELGRRLFALVRAKVHISDLIDQLELELPARLDEPIVAVTGCGKLVKTKKTSTVWKDEAAASRMRDLLRKRVAEKIATNLATGEVDKHTEHIAATAAKEVMDAIGSFSNIVVAAQQRYEIDLRWFRVTTDVDAVAVAPEAGWIK